MSNRTEHVNFRLIHTPCCNYLWCLVNPRLPNYCVECGKPLYAALKTKPECILITDDKATLKYKG